MAMATNTDDVATANIWRLETASSYSYYVATGTIPQQGQRLPRPKAQGWRPEAGGWRLEAGGRRPEAWDPRPPPAISYSRRISCCPTASSFNSCCQHLHSIQLVSSGQSYYCCPHNASCCHHRYYSFWQSYDCLSTSTTELSYHMIVATYNY